MRKVYIYPHTHTHTYKQTLLFLIKKKKKKTNFHQMCRNTSKASNIFVIRNNKRLCFFFLKRELKEYLQNLKLLPPET